MATLNLPTDPTECAQAIACAEDLPFADPLIADLETDHIDHVIAASGREPAFRMLPEGAEQFFLHVNREAAAARIPHAHLWLAVYPDGHSAGIWALPRLSGRGYDSARFSTMPFSRWPLQDNRAYPWRRSS